MATTRSDARFESIEKTLQDLLAGEERRRSKEAADEESRRKGEEEKRTMKEDMLELKHLMTEILKEKRGGGTTEASPSTRRPDRDVGQAEAAEEVADWRDEDVDAPPGGDAWPSIHAPRGTAGPRRTANPTGRPTVDMGHQGRREFFPTDGRQETVMDLEPQGEWGGQRAWCRRVELPVFDGSDPLGWITRAEQYFHIQGTPNDHRVPLAFVSMEGAAVHWFSWLKRLEAEISWEMLRDEMVARFSECDAANPFELLASLEQGNKTVREYIEHFEGLVARLPRLPAPQYLGYFLSGLREDIRRWIRTFDPTTVRRAIFLARNFEEVLGGKSLPPQPSKSSGEGGRAGFSYVSNTASSQGQAGGGWNRQVPFRSEGVSNKSNGGGNSGPAASSAGSNRAQQREEGQAITGGASVVSQNPGSRALSYQDFKTRQEKGLCFRCDQPYHPMHRCANKNLRLMILAEDEEGDLADEELEGEARATWEPGGGTS